MSSANQELQDRAIRHALALGSYGRGVSDKIVRLLNSADKDILERLAVRLALIEERGFDSGPATTARLKTILEEIRLINDAIYQRVQTELTGELQSLAEAEGSFHASSLERSTGLEVAIPAPDRLRVIATESPIEGFLLSSWTAEMSAGRMKRVEQQIRLGMFGGESTDKIVTRIRGSKAANYADGVLDISRRSAQTLVRTAVNHVSNVASQETWKRNSNVVKAWQFLSTLDGRTTVTCAGLSGQTFPVGEGPIPPRHPRCRSISVPVTKSFRELGINARELPEGTRASMDGQVPAKTTFADWLLRKGEPMQNQILGAKRAALWRSGKLDLRDFIKADGSVLTLDQLHARYSDLLG